MGTLIHPEAFRALLYGLKVDRGAAVLPASGTGTIFTVTGGRVIVRGLIGEVTTVCDSTATTLKVSTAPTTGTAVDLTTATAVTSKEVGSLITLPLTLGGALNVQNAGAGQIPGALGFVVPVGGITITTSATNTGAVKWTVLYVPLDDAGAVSAA
jgi:hypothetical protein